MRPTEGLYVGNVVHKRLRPLEHALSYRVFALLLNCDALDDWNARLRWFSYNRRNLFSIFDADHGDGVMPLPDYLRSVADGAGQAVPINKFMMLCYPRVLGYGFNPITVYFGLDAEGGVALMIYEVNNTFGGRKTYVIPVGHTSEQTIVQGIEKQLYVSPFNSVEGRYRFSILARKRALTVGVALRTKIGATLKAHFQGEHIPLSDANLLKQIGTTGWLSVKVTSAIHYEALKLWLKGLQLQPRPENPIDPITYARSSPVQRGDARPHHKQNADRQKHSSSKCE